MPRQGGAAPPRQQPEAVIQPRRQFTNADGIHAAGCQLDGERDAVQPAAYFGHDRCVGILEHEPVEVGRRGAFDEEPGHRETSTLPRH